MPNHNLTEEQEHFYAIRKRWNHFEGKWVRIFLFSMLAVSLIFMKLYAPNSKFSIAIFLLSFAISALVGTAIVFDKATKIFARKLTSEERELLLCVSKSTNHYDFRTASMLLQRCDVATNQELLRASTEPQNDTLLRAAAYTDNTPQEQLLRAANNDESHP